MTVSLDLHGYRIQEAIRIFAGVYNEVVRIGKQEKIVVIHGFHGYALKDGVRAFLNENDILFTRGEDTEKNHGRTIIVPGFTAKPIPEDRVPHTEVTAGLPAMRRRYIFKRIVTFQDEGASATRSWTVASAAFGLSIEQVKAIQKEGIEEKWPPLDN